MGTSQLADRPWLLLPGTLCTHAVFDRFLDALGVNLAHRRHIRLDRPSVTDYTIDFDELSEEAIICGFSLGAIVAAHAADRITAHSLILFGLNPFADDPTKADGRHSLALDVIERGGAAALKLREPEVFGPSPDKIREEIYAMAEHSASMIKAQTQLALTRPGALPALAQAKLPVISFTGSLDCSAPPQQGLAAARAAPNGRFHRLEGLGHFALLEDPIACAAAVTQIIEEIDRAV